MRKIFLFLAALTIAVAANAFTLKFNNGDKTISITSAVDNADVLEDGGSVAVAFDAANKTIKVTFDNATLQSDVNGELFYFKYEDADYTDVKVKLIGKNYLIGEGQWTKPIKIDGPVGGGSVYAHLIFEAGAPGSELNISGQTMLVQINYNAKMTFDNLVTVNITSTSANQPVFYASCGIDDSGELKLYCSLNVKTTGNNLIYMQGGSGPAYLSIGSFGKIRTEGVTVKDNTFVKDDAPYKGDLVYVNAVPIIIGSAGATTNVFPDEECKPAGLKSGTITFDMANYVLTLDKVELDEPIAALFNDLTIYLKGNNIISNSNSKNDSRITVMGYNLMLAGESDATLTIDGNNVCDGLWPLGGLEIFDFGKLTIKNAKNGIIGNGGKLEVDVLKLNSTSMDIQSAEGAIVDFNNVKLLSSDMKWSPAATYNTTTHALEDAESNKLNNVIYSKTTAINQVVNDNVASGKFIRNGQLYILRDGKTFTVTGQEVK